jgi:hypothetical protein
MAALATSAATQQRLRRNCKRMLRQQQGLTSMSAKSRTVPVHRRRSERQLTAQNDRPKTRPTVSECIMLPVETSKRALASKMQTIEIATPF